MSKTKLSMSTTPCACCGLLYPTARAELGYDTCTTCGELEARRVRHTVVPLNKSGYMAYSAEAARTIVKQLNPKRSV
jgi:hypothetical protein